MSLPLSYLVWNKDGIGTENLIEKMIEHYHELCSFYLQNDMDEEYNTFSEAIKRLEDIQKKMENNR